MTYQTKMPKMLFGGNWTWFKFLKTFYRFYQFISFMSPAERWTAMQSSFSIDLYYYNL